MTPRDRAGASFALPAVIGLALALAGCAGFDLSGVLKRPEVSITGAEIEQLTFEGARVRFDVAVSNPNPVGASLAGFDYRLSLEGTEFVKGTVDHAVTVAARGTSTVPVPVAFTYRELFAAVSKLADSSETPYEMAVGFSFTLPVLGTVRVPATFKGTLPVIRAPRVTVASLRLDRLTLTSASLVLSLDIANPNGFTLRLESMDYGFSVAGRQWAAGGTARPLSIASRATGRLDILVALDLLSAGKAVADVLARRGPVPYALEGSVGVATPLPLLKKASVPLRLSGEIPIAR
jgi:LEA14-like dessication related protein